VQDCLDPCRMIALCLLSLSPRLDPASVASFFFVRIDGTVKMNKPSSAFLPIAEAADGCHGARRWCTGGRDEGVCGPCLRFLLGGFRAERHGSSWTMQLLPSNSSSLLLLQFCGSSRPRFMARAHQIGRGSAHLGVQRRLGCSGTRRTELRGKCKNIYFLYFARSRVRFFRRLRASKKCEAATTTIHPS